MPHHAKPEEHSAFPYAFQDSPDAATTALLTEIPGRWGRMPPLSRAVVVEAGQILHKTNRLPERHRSLAQEGKTVGLIGGTRKGSLLTDREFSATLVRGNSLASPALFGYTLPNIPLAEAANHYGLIGPVYAVFHAGNPLGKATEEARRWLRTQENISFMLACEFDHFADAGRDDPLSVTFTIVD